MKDETKKLVNKIAIWILIIFIAFITIISLSGLILPNVYVQRAQTKILNTTSFTVAREEENIDTITWEIDNKHVKTTIGENSNYFLVIDNDFYQVYEEDNTVKKVSLNKTWDDVLESLFGKIDDYDYHTCNINEYCSADNEIRVKTNYWGRLEKITFTYTLDTWHYEDIDGEQVKVYDIQVITLTVSDHGSTTVTYPFNIDSIENE